MPELIRSSPPLTWHDRAAGWAHALRPSRLATAAGAVLLVVVAGWWLLRSPASPVEDHLPMAAGAVAPTTSATARSPTLAGGASSASTGAGQGTGPVPATAGGGADGAVGGVLVVQAAGEVADPGVYRLPAGSRVVDLVAAAGGATPHANVDAVALASKLVDGQRVDVPAEGEPVPAAASGAPPTSAGPTPEAPLDLNTATADQLDALPGVGPATAQAIIAYRTKHGPLRSVDELLEVRGIGPAKLDQLRDLVHV